MSCRFAARWCGSSYITRIESCSEAMAWENTECNPISSALEYDFNILLSVDETDDMETDRPNSPAIACKKKRQRKQPNILS